MRAQVDPGTELESVESETADLEEVSLEDPPPAKRPGLATMAMQRMQRKAAPVHSSTKQSPSGAANLLGSGLARSETAPAADEESARGGEVGGDLRRSFLSSVTFGYFQEVMSTGRRRALETGDLPPLPDEDRAQDIAVQFKRHYARSRRVDAALVATIGRPYLKAALFKLPHDCIVFLTPMLLKALIHLLEADEAVRMQRERRSMEGLLDGGHGGTRCEVTRRADALVEAEPLEFVERRHHRGSSAGGS